MCESPRSGWDLSLCRPRRRRLGLVVGAHVLAEGRRTETRLVTRLAVAATAVVALALAAGAASAPTWGPVTQLSSGDRALGPELATSPAGDAAVVWDQEVGSDCPTSPASLQCAHIVELTTRQRGTSSWSTPIEL